MQCQKIWKYFKRDRMSHRHLSLSLIVSSMGWSGWCPEWFHFPSLFQKSSRKILGLCYFKKRYGPYCDTIMTIFKRKTDCLCFFRLLTLFVLSGFSRNIKNVRVNNYIHFCIFGLYKTKNTFRSSRGQSKDKKLFGTA